MSLLSTLRPARGAEKKARKRRGRGIGTGQGGTAGKGHKGQKARTGGKVRRGFEGGQMPLQRRLPKHGFSNTAFRTEYNVINLKDFEKVKGEISPENLRKLRLIGRGPLKVLATGKLTKAMTVKAHKFSAKAKEAIEKAGGKAEVIS